MDSLVLRAAWLAALQRATSAQLALALKLLMKLTGAAISDSAAVWLSQAIAQAFQVGMTLGLQHYTYALVDA